MAFDTHRKNQKARIRATVLHNLKTDDVSVSRKENL